MNGCDWTSSIWLTCNQFLVAFKIINFSSQYFMLPTVLFIRFHQFHSEIWFFSSIHFSFVWIIISPKFSVSFNLFFSLKNMSAFLTWLIYIVVLQELFMSFNRFYPKIIFCKVFVWNANTKSLFFLYFFIFFLSSEIEIWLINIVLLVTKVWWIMWLMSMILN